MNTIKFSKRANLTTEQHNLELINVEKEIIFRKEFNVYKPCNLNLFVTNVCHNKCFFCINSKYSNTDIDDCTYYYELERVLKELKDKNIEISITGGEPTLKPDRFVKTMQLCKKYNLHCRTVSTVGLKLMEDYEGKPLCKHMIDNDFIHNINISRMCIDEEENNRIFQNRNITNSDIEKLALFFNVNGGEMRISCNIMECGVNSMDSMLNFVDYYRDKNVETIMFRELVGSNNIKLENILKFDESFQYIETLTGLFYDVNVYSYKDMLVKHYITKQSNNIPKDVMFSMSFRNGILQNNFAGEKLND